MTKIQEEILNDLFSSLVESGRVPVGFIEALRRLLEAEGALKASDLVNAFIEASKRVENG